MNKFIRLFPWKLISNKYFKKSAPFIQALYHFCFLNPKILQLHINNECNMNCIYCYNKKEENTLSTEKWISLIAEFKKMKGFLVEVLGGEPFLHKDLYHILSFANEKGLFITIYTNGLLLNKTHIEKLKSFQNLVISVKYGYGSEIYSKNKKKYKMDYTKVEKSIKSLVQERIPVVAFITLTKSNVKNLRGIIQRSVDLGAFPLIERYLPVKDGSTNKKFEIGAEEWDYSLKLILDVYQKFLPLIDGMSLVRGGTCSCFGDLLSVTPGGKVLPCPFAPLSLSLGDVNVDSLKEISNAHRKKMKEWIKIPIGCKDCKNKYLCRGGCKNMRYLKKNNSFNKDILCLKDTPATLGHCAFTVVHNLQNNCNLK